MTRPASLDAAFRRLASALDQVEAAAGRLQRTGADKADLQAVLAAMEEDRVRLALDLDTAMCRTRDLEDATDQVARRLSRAGHVLRQFLADAPDLDAPDLDAPRLDTPVLDASGLAEKLEEGPALVASTRHHARSGDRG
jgi:hypothetical protein